VPPVVSAALVFPACGRSRVEYTCAPGLRSGGGTIMGWVRCHLGSDVVLKAGCGVQAALGLADENCLNARDSRLDQTV
jgi:hypothetical protein